MRSGALPGAVILLGLGAALAFLGFGYALFSDSLRISGAVATGSVNAGFSVHELDEGLVRGAPEGPADNDIDEDLEFGGIDTAECGVLVHARATDLASDARPDVAPSDELVDRAPSDFLFVALRNAYPSFNCYVDFDVHNAGSIPIKVNQPVVGPVPSPDVLTVEFQNCYENGAQVEPGGEVLCTLHVHVERGAEPESLYRFGATICAYQWNAASVVRCAVPVDVEPLPPEIDPAPADVEPLPSETDPAPADGVSDGS